MKTFDSESIYERALTRLQQNPNWKVVAKDSVVTALMKNNSEMLAESARYAEYLFEESRWDTAQNFSSITAAAGMVGYKPSRKISATGALYISADPDIQKVGTLFSAEDLINENYSTLGYLSGLSVSLDSNCTVLDAQGNHYVITTPTPMATNRCIPNVPIIEGRIQNTVVSINTIRSTATRSRLNSYLYIPVVINDAENASSAISKRFFRVFIQHADASETEYRVVDSLIFSNAVDSDVEVYPDLYNNNLLYLKFNADATRGKILDINKGTDVTGIRIQYLKSRGAAGNLLRVFQPFTITAQNGAGSGVITLYGVNLDPITGGRAEESISDIKDNAPYYYLQSYTVGTKEAYERMISRIKFPISAIKNSDDSVGITTSPTRVLVYSGSKRSSDAGVETPITCVTFLLRGLEDLAQTTDSNPYRNIEKILTNYLDPIKSPQDIISFVPPRYVGFSIGLTCTVDSNQVDSVAQLKSDIIESLDNKYGANSDYLDFDRSVYVADIINDVKTEFPGICSVKTEIEACTQINWSEVTRVKPKEDSPQHTLRMPFSFNSLFTGSSYVPGFKDYRSGAAYVMRIDFFYRKPSNSNASDYNVSIFVKEDPNRAKAPFFLIKDNSEVSIWPSTSKLDPKEYQFAQESAGYSQLSTSYQFYMKNKIYSDDAFQSLISRADSGKELQASSSSSSLGAIDAYLISYSGSLKSSSEQNSSTGIGSGFIEIPFEPIFNVLYTYAISDSDLADNLIKYPLANVQCDQAGDVFTSFRNNILSKYLAIYVSMRPVDQDLVIRSTESSPSSDQKTAVLYIDTSDIDSASSKISNISAEKKSRFISVDCSLE